MGFKKTFDTDDTTIFREVASRNDQDRLQQDLNSLQEWETKWLLRFHPQKCKMMTIRSRKKIPPDRQYYLDTQEEEESKRVTLRKVIQEKEVGVTFDERLTFEHHILEKVKKPNQTIVLTR